MSQKFISLEDAATKLGVAKDRLNQLREANELRAYRDGASWKFRTEDIEKLESEGLPGSDPDELTLDAADDYTIGGLDDLPPLAAGSDEGLGNPSTSESDLKLDDDDIGLGIEPLGDGDDAESILLTGDDQLDDKSRPQSTIIGKSELSLEDDLKLASGSDLDSPGAADKPQDKAPATSGSFDDIDELELDLEMESRVMDSREADAARNAVSASAESIEGASIPEEVSLDDELELDLSGSDFSLDSEASDVLTGQESEIGNKAGLSGAGSVSGLSGIDNVQISADDDDDLVLGGSEPSDGSGIDLAASDSGINLSPSDSGFALDEVPLDLGGSAIGSALDLASLSAAGSVPSGLDAGSSSPAAEDFQLTPAAMEEEEEDSSQIVALEEVEEDDEIAFDSADDDDASMDVGFASAISSTPSAVGAPVGAASGSAQEIPFPGWIVGLLGAGFFSMALCGLMALDLLKSMWAWEEPYSLNSTVIEGLLGLFGG